MTRLEGKVAIVTGAARGMGRTIAELFAANGARVIATDVLDAAAYPEGIEFRHLDVTREDEWTDLAHYAEKTYGSIDILVNNAGIIAYEGIDTLAMDSWLKVIAVNQTGVWLGMRAVAPSMKRQSSGSIINTSSIWGNVAVSGAAAYHATKGAVRTLSKNAAMTFVSDGIRVNSVHPGFIETPITEAQAPDLNDIVIGKTPMGRAGKPIEVANGVLFLASDEASFITGSELVIDGGYLAQ